MRPIDDEDDMRTMKLLCIPFSGGNAYSYSSFRKFLPDSITLCPLELPGRGTRIAEPLLYDIDAMTEYLFRQVEHQIDGPYVLFGHSLGALLAFTLCRTLVKKEANLPLALFLSGQTAASLIKNDERYLLPDKQFIDVIRQMEGTPEELFAEKGFVDFFMPIVRADFQAVAKFQYHHYMVPLKLPITVLLGSREAITDEEAMEWQSETEGEVTLFRFEGGHFFINDKAKEVCGLIAERCNQLQEAERMVDNTVSQHPLI
jgi:surfactin synthase thioesterase subunit